MGVTTRAAAITAIAAAVAVGGGAVVMVVDEGYLHSNPAFRPPVLRELGEFSHRIDCDLVKDSSTTKIKTDEDGWRCDKPLEKQKVSVPQGDRFTWHDR